MSKALGLLVIGIVVASGIGLYFGWFQPPETTATMTIEWAVADELSSTAVPDTADLYLYVEKDGNLVTRDSKLDFSSETIETTKKYTTGEKIYGKIVDPTDTSYCTLYFTWTVPAPNAYDLEDAKFHADVYVRNMPDSGGDATMDWDPALMMDNGTSITASSTQDVTNNSWDSDMVYITNYIYNRVDNTGYLASYNFEDERKNNAYLFMSFSGTGWDRISIRSGFDATFERNNILYGIVKLTDDDLSRDISTSGGFIGSRNGVATYDFVFDLTGFESGDSVTWTYGLYYYSDWDYFQSNGNWGPDSVSITESVTLQY